MSRKKYIDLLDITLLNTLVEEPESSIAELGDKVSLTPGPTHSRIVHLKDEGFYKNACTIDYSKFGLQEHLYSFKLIEDTDSANKWDPESTYEDVKDVLSKAKGTLVISFDISEDVQTNSHWITVHYYPMYSERTYELRGLKKKESLEASDKLEIQSLLKKFAESDSGTFRVLKKHEFLSSLNIGHVQRKKPE